MISTKLFKRVLLASALAFLPLSAFAEGETDVNYETASAFYVKGFYNAGYIGSNDFENSGTSGVAAVGKKATGTGGSVVQGSVNGEYDPDYEINFLGGGLALGYSYGGLRVELEGLFTGDIEIDEGGEFYAATKVPAELATDGNYLDGINTVAVGPVHNNKFSYMVGFLNAYYDMSVNSTAIPYIGVGIGIAGVTFNGEQKIDSYPMALQGKIGIGFNTSGFTRIAMMPYVGYRILYLMTTDADDSITDLPVLRKDNNGDVLKSSVGGINYKMENSYLSHNLELGLMIPLNA